MNGYKPGIRISDFQIIRVILRALVYMYIYVCINLLTEKHHLPHFPERPMARFVNNKELL